MTPYFYSLGGLKDRHLEKNAYKSGEIVMSFLDYVPQKVLIRNGST